MEKQLTISDLYQKVVRLAHEAIFESFLLGSTIPSQETLMAQLREMTGLPEPDENEVQASQSGNSRRL